MLLSLCLLLPALSPSSQKICSAPADLPAPTLYMSKSSAQPGDSMQFQCSAFSWAWATRIIFCKDGEEVFTHRALEEKNTDDYEHVVSRGSSGNYSCRYEIQDDDNRVYRSQLSPAQHLSVTALSTTSQEICSALGALPAPTLYLNQTSARPGDFVQLQCSVFSQAPATHVIFCKDGEEVSSQSGSEVKVVHSYIHVVSSNSSGRYACGYEIKDNNTQMTRSQLSPAQYLSVTGKGDYSSGGVGGSSSPGLTVSLVIWAARCILVLLLLASAPIITFMLEKRSLPHLQG